MIEDLVEELGFFIYNKIEGVLYIKSAKNYT